MNSEKASINRKIFSPAKAFKDAVKLPHVQRTKNKKNVIFFQCKKTADCNINLLVMLLPLILSPMI